MPKASITIRISEKDIMLDGNEEIIWYLQDKLKGKFLEEILETLLKYKELKRKKGKMNIIIIGIDDKYMKILEKYKEHFNFIFEKSYQKKIINFLK